MPEKGATFDGSTTISGHEHRLWFGSERNDLRSPESNWAKGLNETEIAVN
jgi:hypothetical protein